MPCCFRNSSAPHCKACCSVCMHSLLLKSLLLIQHSSAPERLECFSSLHFIYLLQLKAGRLYSIFVRLFFSVAYKLPNYLLQKWVYLSTLTNSHSTILFFYIFINLLYCNFYSFWLKRILLNILKDIFFLYCKLQYSTKNFVLFLINY